MFMNIIFALVYVKKKFNNERYFFYLQVGFYVCAVEYSMMNNIYLEKKIKGNVANLIQKGQFKKAHLIQESIKP